MPATRTTLLQAVAASPQLIKFVPSAAAVTSLRTSVDGRMVVAGDRDGHVQVLDYSGAVMFSATMSGPITAVAVDSSGGTVVAATMTTVAFWDRHHQQAGARLVELPNPVLDAAVDEKLGGIAVLQSRPDAGGAQLIGRVQILDQRTLTTRAAMDVDVGSADFFPTEDPRPHLAVGADGQVHVASGACDRVSLNEFDLTPTKVVRQVCTPVNRYIEAASAAGTSGAWVHVGGYGEVHEGDSAKPRGFVNLPVDQPEVLAISPNGDRLAVSQGDVIYLARPSADEATATTTVRLEGTSGISAIEFLAGDRLVSAGIGGLALWDTATPGPLARPAGVRTPDTVGFIDAPSLQLCSCSA